MTKQNPTHYTIEYTERPKGILGRFKKPVTKKIRLDKKFTSQFKTLRSVNSKNSITLYDHITLLDVVLDLSRIEDANIIFDEVFQETDSNVEENEHTYSGRYESSELQADDLASSRYETPSYTSSSHSGSSSSSSSDYSSSSSSDYSSSSSSGD